MNVVIGYRPISIFWERAKHSSNTKYGSLSCAVSFIGKKPMAQIIIAMKHRMIHLPWFDRQVPRKPRLVGGGGETQWVEKPNGSRGTIKNDISLARILLATACPGSPALWAGSFTIDRGYTVRHESFDRAQDRESFDLAQDRESFDLAQDRESFDLAQDRELVERLVEWLTQSHELVEWKSDFLRSHQDWISI